MAKVALMNNVPVKRGFIQFRPTGFKEVSHADPVLVIDHGPHKGIWEAVTGMSTQLPDGSWTSQLYMPKAT